MTKIRYFKNRTENRLISSPCHKKYDKILWFASNSSKNWKNGEHSISWVQIFRKDALIVVQKGKISFMAFPWVLFLTKKSGIVTQMGTSFWLYATCLFTTWYIPCRQSIVQYIIINFCHCIYDANPSIIPTQSSQSFFKEHYQFGRRPSQRITSYKHDVEKET